MKEEGKNEKYIILFTDLINLNFHEEKQIEIEKNIGNIKENKDIRFLLIGKIKIKNLDNEQNDNILNENNLEDLILSKK